MNDITALMATMKAAAEKATPGEWRAFSHPASGTYAVHTPKDKRCEDVIKWPGFDGQQNAAGNAEFIAAANPANVKTLVEALEKAQQRIAELEKYAEAEATGADKAAENGVYWMRRCKEIESRTVTVKLAEDKPAESESEVDDAEAWFYEGWNSRGEADRDALAAAGIQVIEGEGQ